MRNSFLTIVLLLTIDELWSRKNDKFLNLQKLNDVQLKKLYRDGLLPYSKITNTNSSSPTEAVLSTNNTSLNKYYKVRNEINISSSLLELLKLIGHLMSSFGQVFPLLMTLLPLLAPFFGSLVPIFLSLLPVFNDFLPLFKAYLPMFPTLLKFVDAIVPVLSLLVPLINILSEMRSLVISVCVDVLKAFVPFLPYFTEFSIATFRPIINGMVIFLELLLPGYTFTLTRIIAPMGKLLLEALFVTSTPFMAFVTNLLNAAGGYRPKMLP